MKQVITLAQLNAAMVSNACTAEAILAQYDCPEYMAQTAPVVAAAPVAAHVVAEAVVTPVAAAVVQSTAPFDLMSFAQTTVPAAGSEKRTPAWECDIVELRSRVIIRDLQTPQKRDEANAKLRINLAPVYVDLTAYGTTTSPVDGSVAPIIHFVVPREHEEAAKAKIFADVQSGMHDVALKEAALKVKASAEKKAANRLIKAPQDTAAAMDALAALEAQSAPVVGLEQAAIADLGLAGITLPVLG